MVETPILNKLGLREKQKRPIGRCLRPIALKRIGTADEVPTRGGSCCPKNRATYRHGSIIEAASAWLKKKAEMATARCRGDAGLTGIGWQVLLEFQRDWRARNIDEE